MDDLYKVKGQARLFSTKNNKISRTFFYYNMILSFFDGTGAKMTDKTIEILPAIYNKMPVMLKSRDGREIKYIRPDEVQNIVWFLGGRDRVFVDILWNTGGRVSEGLMVTSGRINFERSTIQSQRSKKRR